MKKNLLLLLIPALALVFFVSSCKKDDPTPPANTTIGKWNGTYTPTGGTAGYFSLNFKSGGQLDVQANDATNPDLGTGTYTVTGNTVKGSFIYNVGIGVIYLFEGNYSTNNTIISGTIGISPSYSGNATFTITKP